MQLKARNSPEVGRKGRGDGRTHLIFIVRRSPVWTVSGEGERRNSGKDDESKYKHSCARAECESCSSESPVTLEKSVKKKVGAGFGFIRILAAAHL